MKVTDQLFYEGRVPSQDELDRIKHCSIKKQSAEYGNKQEQITQPQSGKRFDVEAYDFECAKEVLGPATTDLLFFKAQSPTQDQLKDIDRCRRSDDLAQPSGNDLELLPSSDPAGPVRRMVKRSPLPE